MIAYDPEIRTFISVFVRWRLILLARPKRSTHITVLHVSSTLQVSEPGASGEDPAEPLRVSVPDERHVPGVQPAGGVAVNPVLHHHCRPGE